MRGARRTPNDPRSIRRWVAAWALALLSWCAVAPVRAQVEITAPESWSTGNEAPDRARVEAARWAQATGLEIALVAAPDEQDDFDENLVVLRGKTPLPADVLQDVDAASAWLDRTLPPIVGGDAPADRLELTPVGDVRGVRARSVAGTAAFDVLLVPAGAEHAVVVLKTSAAEQSLYRGWFDEIAADVRGLAEPIAPFPRQAARWGGLLGFLALALAVGWAVTAATRAAATLLALSLVGASLVYGLLGAASLEPGLALAATSRGQVALETLGFGLAATLLVWLRGRLHGDDGGRIDSAPRTGVFARGAADREHAAVPRRLGPRADAGVETLGRPASGAGESGARPRSGESGARPRPRR